MLNNLRKVIEHMDDVKLVYDNLKYKIVFSSLYVDVLRFQELLARGTESKELTAIIGRGKFLSSIEDFAYDDLKTKIEQYSVDYLSKLIDEKYNNNQFLETISLTKILLHLDPIYQLAVYKEIKSLYKLGNIAEAKKKYERFIRTYQEYMGQPFECSFDELIQMKS